MKRLPMQVNFWKLNQEISGRRFQTCSRMKRWNGIIKGICLGFMVLSVLNFITTGALAKDSKFNKKQFDVELLLKIDNPKAEFKVDLWTDRDDATYMIGDQVTFFFKTDKDCRVTLLSIGSDGTVQILFPNDYHKDNLVKAATIYTIPPRDARFAIKAKAPAGNDMVKAIATLDKVALIKDEDIIPVRGFIKGFKKVKKNVKVLAIELEETLRPVNPRNWAETQKIVKIVPNISE